MNKSLSFSIIVLLFLSSIMSAQNLDDSTKGLPKIEPFRISPGKSFSASVPTSSSRKNRPSDFKPRIVSRDFNAALDIIHNFHVGGQNNKTALLTKSAIESMLHTLDPHSGYFDSKEYRELLSDQRSEYFGIGATIANYKRKGVYDTYVTSSFPGSPAFRSRLGFGDKILEVNGEDVRRKSSLYVRNRIRGKKGSIVRLKIQKNGTKLIDTIVIRRNRVAQPSIPDAYMLKPGIAYVDLSKGFNYTTIEELDSALTELKKAGMTSLILDLRDNPGGILEQAIRVAEKFLRKGNTIATQRGRLIIDNRIWKSRNKNPDRYPLVVLVNDESASASEIVAGALQDYDRALILGEKTFGKGLVQSVINLPFGAGLTLTTAKYYTPSGRLIQRDYANGNLYDYYQHNEKSAGVGAKVARRTIGGRPVYSGDGISPDIEVTSSPLSANQVSLIDAIFHFSTELTAGRIPELEHHSVLRQLDEAKRIKPGDFVVDQNVSRAFREFTKKQGFNLNERTIASEVEFISSRIRFNLVSAKYGNVIAKQVLIENDRQVMRAISAIPAARGMAAAR